MNNKKTIQLKQKWTKDLDRHFSRGDKPMPSKHIKRCPTLLVIREMKIKLQEPFHTL